MLIGVPKEVKADEYRVRLVPATIKELTAQARRRRRNQGGRGRRRDRQRIYSGWRGIVPNPDRIFSQADLLDDVHLQNGLNVHNGKKHLSRRGGGAAPAFFTRPDDAISM